MYQHWHIKDVRELLRDNNLPVLHVKDVSGEKHGPVFSGNTVS